MSFGPYHYVPVLKVKRGEKKALQSVSPKYASRISPLLEIVERNNEKKPTPTAHLDTAFKDLAVSVQQYSNCFLDAREIAPDGPDVAANVFQRAAAEGITFTPVTGISRTADVAAALQNRDNGIALRLMRSEFEEGNLTHRVNSFLNQKGLKPAEVDLIVDLGTVHDLVVSGITTLTKAFLGDVPVHGQWNTLTVSACAFPYSMSVVGRDSHKFVERAEWMAWRDGLYVNRTDRRLPTFSDSAIQHSTGVEGFDPRIMPVSASIRYAVSDGWLLIKGESTRRTPPSRQFPVLATRLAYGFLRSHFAGADHCVGCESIKNAADGAPRLGSPEAWRRIGTTHHITTVMEDLASLSWP